MEFTERGFNTMQMTYKHTGLFVRKRIYCVTGISDEPSLVIIYEHKTGYDTCVTHVIYTVRH